MSVAAARNTSEDLIKAAILKSKVKVPLSRSAVEAQTRIAMETIDLALEEVKKEEALIVIVAQAITDAIVDAMVVSIMDAVDLTITMTSER